MSNWINVKDKLPPEKTFHPVYITAIYSHFKEKYHVEPLHWIGGEWFEMVYEEPLDTSEYEVTHWMELPNPPENKDSE